MFVFLLIGVGSTVLKQLQNDLTEVSSRLSNTNEQLESTTEELSKKKQEILEKEQEVKQKDQEVKQKEEDLALANFELIEAKSQVDRTREALENSKDSLLIAKTEVRRSQGIAESKQIATKALDYVESDPIRSLLLLEYAKLKTKEFDYLDPFVENTFNDQAQRVSGVGLYGHSTGVESAIFSKDATLALSGDREGKVIVWDVRDKNGPCN